MASSNPSVAFIDFWFGISPPNPLALTMLGNNDSLPSRSNEARKGLAMEAEPGDFLQALQAFKESGAK